MLRHVTFTCASFQPTAHGASLSEAMRCLLQMESPSPTLGKGDVVWNFHINYKDSRMGEHGLGG